MHEYTVEKKEEYWMHMVEFIRRRRWNYLSPRRLKMAKNGLWENDNFWFDVLYRHPGNEMIPEEMKEKKADIYNHMIGNMVGMVTGYLCEIKEIRP